MHQPLRPLPARGVFVVQLLWAPPAHDDKLQSRQYSLPSDTRHLSQVWHYQKSWWTVCPLYPEEVQHVAITYLTWNIQRGGFMRVFLQQITDIVLGSPEFNFPTTLVNSQLVRCLNSASSGILNLVMFIWLFIYHYLFTLVLKSPDGEWPMTYTFFTYTTVLRKLVSVSKASWFFCPFLECFPPGCWLPSRSDCFQGLGQRKQVTRHLQGAPV